MSDEAGETSEVVVRDVDALHDDTAPLSSLYIYLLSQWVILSFAETKV